MIQTRSLFCNQWFTSLKFCVMFCVISVQNLCSKSQLEASKRHCRSQRSLLPTLQPDFILKPHKSMTPNSTFMNRGNGIDRLCSVFGSFLDQVGSEESSCVPSSPPAALETSSSDTDIPAVRHTNITDLINESYEVRKHTDLIVEADIGILLLFLHTLCKDFNFF